MQKRKNNPALWLVYSSASASDSDNLVFTWSWAERKCRSRKRSRKKMEPFWFFWLRFRRAYDSAYDSDFWFSLGHKRSYDSAYDSDSDSDSVASENQPLWKQQEQIWGRMRRPRRLRSPEKNYVLSRRSWSPWCPYRRANIKWEVGCARFHCMISLHNQKNYNFLNCDWFKKLLFPTNSLAKLLSDNSCLVKSVCVALLFPSSSETGSWSSAYHFLLLKGLPMQSKKRKKGHLFFPVCQPKPSDEVLCASGEILWRLREL